MSDAPRQKFRTGLRTHERFLNIFSVRNTFTLMALLSFTPVYKGQNPAAMASRHHVKIFFKIRQKTYERSYGGWL
jgi:hypothetical protein